MNLESFSTSTAAIPEIQDEKPSIIDAVDMMAQARFMIECVRMAASELERRQAEAIVAVATIAIDKLIESRDMLDACRAAEKGGHA
ncbi:hypothetical protein ACSBOB_01720 [Mesorhizobium sp. ASY16-5R]|uniref:hypothetical protein n=1 Tax=Mesorhizobium sp. ASY16-5R TaxID=3445772 RepID=UPI003FA0602F